MNQEEANKQEELSSRVDPFNTYFEVLLGSPVHARHHLPFDRPRSGALRVVQQSRRLPREVPRDLRCLAEPEAQPEPERGSPPNQERPGRPRSLRRRTANREKDPRLVPLLEVPQGKSELQEEGKRAGRHGPETPADPPERPGRGPRLLRCEQPVLHLDRRIPARQQQTSHALSLLRHQIQRPDPQDCHDRRPRCIARSVCLFSQSEVDRHPHEECGRDPGGHPSKARSESRPDPPPLPREPQTGGHSRDCQSEHDTKVESRRTQKADSSRRRRQKQRHRCPERHPAELDGTDIPDQELHDAQEDQGSID